MPSVRNGKGLRIRHALPFGPAFITKRPGAFSVLAFIRALAVKCFSSLDILSSVSCLLLQALPDFPSLYNPSILPTLPSPIPAPLTYTPKKAAPHSSEPVINHKTTI
jgi:hypothetical protein